MTNIAIIGMGAMGSAIGQVLVAKGARVTTVLEGRSGRTLARARLAGVISVSPSEIPGADIILAVVPPSDALATAKHIKELLKQSDGSPAYLDLNAISPATMKQIETVFLGTNADVVDGAIIGTPPRSDGYTPTIYVSGDAKGKTAILGDYGLRLKQLDGPLGAASALKMCYAGINKGFAGIGAAMLLAARQTRSEFSLRAELADSLPVFGERLEIAIPDMLPKARRWVAEMDEISDFLGPSDPAQAIYRAFGRFFAEIADDFDNDGERTHALLKSARSDR